jgi:DnaJ-class molecular chaperone
MNEVALTIRISSDLKKRLYAASEGLYAPSQSEIVRRGIELALTELKRRQEIGATAMAPKIVRECDVCDGTGQEEDDDGFPVDCHLCEGAGGFGEDGFPVDEAD